MKNTRFIFSLYIIAFDYNTYKKYRLICPYNLHLIDNLIEPVKYPIKKKPPSNRHEFQSSKKKLFSSLKVHASRSSQLLTIVTVSFLPLFERRAPPAAQLFYYYDEPCRRALTRRNDYKVYLQRWWIMSATVHSSTLYYIKTLLITLICALVGCKNTVLRDLVHSITRVIITLS